MPGPVCCLLGACCPLGAQIQAIADELTASGVDPKTARRAAGAMARKIRTAWKAEMVKARAKRLRG